MITFILVKIRVGEANQLRYSKWGFFSGSFSFITLRAAIPVIDDHVLDSRPTESSIV